MIVFVTSRFLSGYDFNELKDKKLAFVGNQSDVPSDKYKKHFSTVLLYESLNDHAVKDAAKHLDSDTSLVLCNDDITRPFAEKLKVALKLSSTKMGDFNCKLSDKVFQKQLIQELPNIYAPEFLSLEPDCLACLDTVNWSSVVLKPRVSASSKGLTIFYDDLYWKTVVKDLLSRPEGLTNYECERYIDGDMYHVDTLRSSGEEVFSIACKYNRPMGEFLEGHPIGSLALANDNPVATRLKSANAKILDVFKHQNGASHMEFIVEKTSGRLYFIEFARRFPGGLAIPLYEKMFNQHLLNLELNVLSGTNTPRLNASGGGFWVLFPKKSGKVGNKNICRIDNLGFDLDFCYLLYPDVVTEASYSLQQRAAECLAYVKESPNDEIASLFERMCRFEPYSIDSKN